jgi:ATP-binding cassette, subfamily B, bacterial CvaB/MchF/RaxB
MIDFRLFAARRLPFVAASELNECGLACLASVSAFFRGEQGLPEIRQMAMQSGRGANLLAIRNLAEQLGLSARAVRVGLPRLDELSKPAILHWDMNHFVALERVTRSGIVIMDPAAGRMHVPWDQANKSFTGVALELRTSERWKVRASSARKVSALSFIGPLGRWRTDISLIVMLSLLMEVLILLTPLQMQMSIDHAVQAADGRLVWVLGAGFGFVVLLKACVSLIRAWSSSVFGMRVGFELHDRFVRSLHNKPAAFFVKHHTADILNRGRSVDAIRALMTGQLLQVVLDALMSVAMVTVMFLAVPLMALVVVGFALVSVATTMALGNPAIDNSRQRLRAGARVDSLFLENARAARAIKLYGKEMIRTNLWRNRFVELTNLSLTGERLKIFATQTAQVSSDAGNVVLISVGTYLVLAGSITLGTMMMFFAFRMFFVERLYNCVDFLMQLRLVETHAERIDEVIGEEAAEPAGQDLAPQGIAVEPAAGVSIEVKDVWFRYGKDSPWILQGASLRIEAGESVAITGASGSGKTTLMHIMLGLLQPERGEVRINDRDLRTISSHDYARIIGVVMQDDLLFQGTIADNIAFFEAPFDLHRVAHAAEKANIAREIQAMPMQYYSLLAEAAQDISGGQKQRLFIARALYNEPKILFLDEATSHLDADSERLVSQAIRALRLTRVLIAHRKETVATADRVLVLNAGTVVERDDAHATASLPLRPYG